MCLCTLLNELSGANTPTHPSSDMVWPTEPACRNYYQSCDYHEQSSAMFGGWLLGHQESCVMGGWVNHHQSKGGWLCYQQSYPRKVGAFYENVNARIGCVLTCVSEIMCVSCEILNLNEYY